jgi:peptidoglycan glycosyltransferase
MRKREKRPEQSTTGHSTDRQRKRENREKSRKRNKHILIVTYVYLALFAGLIGYIVYFTTTKSKSIINNTYNTRLEKLSKQYVRGDILAADGSVLATTKVDDDGEETRSYPYGAAFAHVVGYSTQGETGLEAASNYYLLNSHISSWNQFVQQLQDKKTTGDTVVTTLNAQLQQVLYDAMDGYQGAAVVIKPSTGEILAMVSKPDYDPNEIDKIYQDLISDSKNTNLVNRATQGLYSPGSTFKLVTLLEYMKENPGEIEDFSYNCEGSITIDDNTVKCSHGAHGVVSAREAFAYSCNGAFIEMGMNLNLKSFRKTAETLLFNQKIPYSLGAAQSKFTLNSKSSDWEVMQTSFGQGSTEITPLHNAMLLAAIANGGVLMKPYLIDHVETSEGEVVESFLPETYGTLMTSEQAEVLIDYMVSVVNDGTGSVVQSDAYQAAGKTGSAQFDSDKQTHAWFVGLAPADDPEVVVSIVLEEAGAGGENAGPIAKKIFDTLLNP